LRRRSARIERRAHRFSLESRLPDEQLENRRAFGWLLEAFVGRR